MRVHPTSSALRDRINGAAGDVTLLLADGTELTGPAACTDAGNVVARALGLRKGWDKCPRLSGGCLGPVEWTVDLDAVIAVSA